MTWRPRHLYDRHAKHEGGGRHVEPCRGRESLSWVELLFWILEDRTVLLPTVHIATVVSSEQHCKDKNKINSLLFPNTGTCLSKVSQ